MNFSNDLPCIQDSKEIASIQYTLINQQVSHQRISYTNSIYGSLIGLTFWYWWLPNEFLRALEILWIKLSPTALSIDSLLPHDLVSWGHLYHVGFPNCWNRNSYNTMVAFCSSHVIVRSISHMTLLPISQFAISNQSLKTIVATSNHNRCSCCCPI